MSLERMNFYFIYQAVTRYKAAYVNIEVINYRMPVRILVQ